MALRFVGRLAIADFVTILNAVLGFLAVVFAFQDIALAARIMLLAAILDGLDGVLARRYGSSDAGPYLDSLADVASFAVAPATVVAALLTESGMRAVTDPWTIAAYLVGAAFVASAVTRLGLYTVHDTDANYTLGVPSTLAATVIGAAVLTDMISPFVVFGATFAFCYLMVARIQYPDLLARDALIMGVVHVLAVVFPTALGNSFPVALLLLGLAYMFLSPWFYWREESTAKLTA